MANTFADYTKRAGPAPAPDDTGKRPADYFYFNLKRTALNLVLCDTDCHTVLVVVAERLNT